MNAEHKRVRPTVARMNEITAALADMTRWREVGIQECIRLRAELRQALEGWRLADETRRVLALELARVKAGGDA